MVVRSLEIYKLFQFSDRLYMSESDFCRRQISTYKDGTRTERVIHAVKNNIDSMCFVKIVIVFTIDSSLTLIKHQAMFQCLSVL